MNIETTCTSNVGQAFIQLPEPLRLLMEQYQRRIELHPAIRSSKTAGLTLPELVRFSITQFGDCIWWVPMLALIKERVRNERLRQAAFDNLRCESGGGSVSQQSHIGLCYRFVQALGVTNADIARLGNIPAHRESVVAILSLAAADEAFIAGWLLAAEGLVPVMFAGILPSFRTILAAEDVEYLSEHVAVDEDEHVQWMIAAVNELVAEGAPLESVGNGIRRAGDITLSFLDDVQRIVRYDTRIPFMELVAAADCEDICIAPDAEYCVPTDFTGTGLVRTYQVPKEIETAGGAVRNTMAERGKPLVHPLVLLTFAGKYPDEQRAHPLVTFWQDRNGDWWYAYLGEHNGRRRLVIHRQQFDTLNGGLVGDIHYLCGQELDDGCT